MTQSVRGNDTGKIQYAIALNIVQSLLTIRPFCCIILGMQILIIRKLFITRIFLLIFFLFSIVLASNTLVLYDSKDQHDSYTLKYPPILIDKTSKLTIEDILSKQPKFQTSRFKYPNYGYSLSAYWTTFTLKNESMINQDWYIELDYTLLDSIDIFTINKDGSYIKRSAGRIYPFKDNELKNRNFGFKIHLDYGKEQTYYLRIKTEDTSAFPIIISTPEAFIKKNVNYHFAFGIYYGILLIMIFYNFFLFLSLKDINFLFYVMYVISYGLFQILFNGLAYEYFWPNSPRLNIIAFPFSIAFAHIFSILFTRKFLQTKLYAPKTEILLKYLQVFAVILCFLSLVLPYIITITLGTILPIIFSISAISASIICLIKGYRPARFFLIAWSLLLVGIFVLSLKCSGVIPVNFITIYGVQIGSVIELMMLSFALGDRISIIKSEKDKQEKQLISLKKELELGRKIQQSIIPTHFPKIEGITVFAKYLPMEAVGGDYYDFRVNAQSLTIFIADVSGHGLAAAMVASMAKVAFSTESFMSSSPKNILTGMNTHLFDQFKGKYLTALAISVDIANKRLSLSNAGHLPLIILRNNQVTSDENETSASLPEHLCHPLSACGEREVSNEDVALATGERRDSSSSLDFIEIYEIIEITTEGGFPIGWWENNHLEEVGIDLQSGDRILLYTDCILEAKNNAKEQFEKENFHNFIKENALLDAPTFVDKLVSTLKAWTASDTLDDDLAMVVVDVT